MAPALRVLVWNEGRHEQLTDGRGISGHYPDGIHGAIAEGIRGHLPDADVRIATLDSPGQGLTEADLQDVDVILWWGHMAHDEVADEAVDRLQRLVLSGTGLIVLHSGHFSKIFRRLMGTTCSLQWRNSGERELVWPIQPNHAIAEGLPRAPLVIEAHEMYGEVFDVPTPDELVFISSFAGGEVFRSGMTFVRGNGRIFYFSPGDQEYPIYHREDVRLVLANAIRWAAPRGERHLPGVTNPKAGWFLPN